MGSWDIIVKSDRCAYEGKAYPKGSGTEKSMCYHPDHVTRRTWSGARARWEPIPEKECHIDNCPISRDPVKNDGVHGCINQDDCYILCSECSCDDVDSCQRPDCVIILKKDIVPILRLSPNYKEAVK